MAKVTLNGLHGDSRSSNGWTFTTGAQPSFGEFEMKAEEAAILLEGLTSLVTLQVPGRGLTIQSLLVVGEGVSSAPMYRTVILADLRWFWSRKHILARYNIRRRTGTKTLEAEGGPKELAQVSTDFTFAPWSLKNKEKWSPREVMEDLLNRLQAAGGFPFEIQTIREGLEVNDLDIDDNGNTAMQLALRHLTGMSLRVSKGGKVIVFDSINLSENSILNSTGPEIIGGGHVSFADLSRSRPSEIHVLFTREPEVRFDSVLEGAEVTEDQRFLTNVVQITDPTLTISGRKRGRGSWVPIESVFTPWNASRLTLKGQTVGKPLTHSRIQAAFFADKLLRIYVPLGKGEPQPIWVGRITAIKHNYWQTFQINRRWMDRFYTVLPIRTGILDQETGIRSRSWAYSDYCVRQSGRGMLEKAVGSQRMYANIFGYKANIGLAEPSPAIVQVYDNEAGILHLDYKVDPYGLVKQIFPAAVDNLPTANIGDKFPRGLDVKVGPFGLVPKLKANSRIAVVLTCIPAAPNSVGQLHRIIIKPDDVTDRLSPNATITPARGPKWEIRVHPGMITARMAWLDLYAKTIERMFGIGISDDPSTRAEQDLLDEGVKELLTINHTDLVEVAKATAARLWSKLTDRNIGSKTVRLDPTVEPIGAISLVRHEVTTEGREHTFIQLAEELADRNVLAMLPEGLRKIILREVIPPAGQQ
ncbi:hypothetical protein [uncultured Mediterranean phage]|nr:hypothetical protein [uncultured Mediterranean phage]